MTFQSLARRIAAVPALVALAGAASAQHKSSPRPVAAAPASKWSVSSDPFECRLVQLVDGKSHLIALGPGAYRLLLAFAAPAESPAYRWRSAGIGGPASSAFGGRALVALATSPNDEPIALGVTFAQFQALGERPVELAVEGHGGWAFPAIDRSARAKLERCERSRLIAWGVPAAILDSVHRRPEFDGQPWFRSEDYPANALSEDAQGNAVALLQFSAEGKVDGCTLIRSAAHDALDGATCAVARRKGHARPARDSKDVPVPSVGLMTIAWRIG